MNPIDYTIKTDQPTLHPQLIEGVQKHIAHPFLRPIPDHQRAVFEQAHAWVHREARPIILDSGCGTAMSTAILGRRYPGHWVVGVDKSIARLSRGEQSALPDNVLLVRADCVDFWRLAAAHCWPVEKHYLLYPNPWPKASQWMRRWHGHPIFPTLMKLSKHIEVRSNWDLYVREFQKAAEIFAPRTNEISVYHTDTPMTLFERKYWAAQILTYRLEIVRLA